MAISIYDFSVPVFTHLLVNLSKIIDKASAYAESRKIDPKVLFDARLAPDMFPFSRQVQIACDFAKGTTARLAGVDVPKHEDNEATLADLKARIAKTLDFVGSIKPGQLAGSEERQIVHEMRVMKLEMKGLQYLTAFSLPNFFFHVTTAYDILRHNGMELGKRDYAGPI